MTDDECFCQGVRGQCFVIGRGAEFVVLVIEGYGLELQGLV